MEKSSQPEKQIKTWTQEDIELLQLFYRQTSIEKAIADSFEFLVSDGSVCSLHEVCFILCILYTCLTNI